jgi:hypothetical protein
LSSTVDFTVDTGSLAISVGGSVCVIVDAYFETPTATNDTAASDNGTCMPPSGYAKCKLPAGTDNLQFVTLTDITGTASAQVCMQPHLLAVHV